MRGLILLLPVLLVLFLAGLHKCLFFLLIHLISSINLLINKESKQPISFKKYFFMTGSARTEEQSSLVEEAKLASNLLPLEEKVKISNPKRDAGFLNSEIMRGEMLPLDKCVLDSGVAHCCISKQIVEILPS